MHNAQTGQHRLWYDEEQDRVQTLWS